MRTYFSRLAFYISWVFLILIYLLLPLDHLDAYAWNYDEGPQLQAAALVHEGYPLYSEVVVNKPPLLSWILAVGFELLGMNLITARLVMLLISLVGFVALGALSELWWGRGAGIGAMALLLLLPEVPVRAAVVMNDLPALSMGMLALVAATRYRTTRSKISLWASAMAYALALLIHPLFFYFAGPLLLLLFSPGRRTFPLEKQAFWLALWGMVVILIVALALLPVDWQAFNHWVLGYNLNAELSSRISENWHRLLAYGQAHVVLVVMAMLSAVVVWVASPRNRSRMGLILIWFYATVGVLSFLRPLWPHYTLLTIFPLVSLCGGGLATTVRWVAGRKPFACGPLFRWGATALLLLGLGWMGVQRFSVTLDWMPWAPDERDVQDYLQRECRAGDFIISDRQFLAFASGCLVPPPLADTSGKRMGTGLLTQSDIVDALMRYPVRFFAVATGLYKEEFNFQKGESILATSKDCFGPACIYRFDRARFTPDSVCDVQVGDAVRLWGYNLSGALEPGSQPLVILFWEAFSTPVEDWKVFVHLLSPSGDLIAQHDGIPFMGGAPTSTWKPGYQIIDPHPLVLPADFGTENYKIVVGMYREPTFERLPAFDAEGRYPDDVIVLPVVGDTP